MPCVAVTGAAGFVGSHVVPALLGEGRDVRGLVRPGGRQPVTSGVDYVEGDVRSVDTVRALLHDCDTVIHLAASFSPVDDPARVIVDGTRAMLDAARDAGVARIVVVSCLGAEAAAHSPYLVAKWKAEQLVRGSGVPYVILRSSLILGEGDRVCRPLANLVRTLPVIPIPYRGENRTQPLDVNDVVRCIIAALGDDSLLGEAVSIGGPMYITFRQLADLMSGRLNVLKPKVLLPQSWLPAFYRWLPGTMRELYAPARLAILQQDVVTSPGIVQRMFGFEPRSVVPLLPTYLG